MSKRGHRTFGLFAHITWHTWRRERSVRRSEVDVVGRGILSAAERQSVHVLAQAVLADHVHVVISVRPDRAITPSGSIDRPRPHPGDTGNVRTSRACRLSIDSPFS